MLQPKKNLQLIKVMFVCLGNICRSPLALYIFNDIIQKNNLSSYFYTDSSGTSNYNNGNKADSRSILIGKNHNLDLSNHIAKQIKNNDFLSFDYILCMDTNNLKVLNTLKPTNTTAKIHLVTDFNQKKETTINIKDPYYLDLKDFESTYINLSISLNNFFIYLKTNQLG